MKPPVRFKESYLESHFIKNSSKTSLDLSLESLALKPVAPQDIEIVLVVDNAVRPVSPASMHQTRDNKHHWHERLVHLNWMMSWEFIGK